MKKFRLVCALALLPCCDSTNVYREQRRAELDRYSARTEKVSAALREIEARKSALDERQEKDTARLLGREMPAEQRREIEPRIARLYKDPESTNFRWTECHVEVNSKNSYGAYVGYEYFAVFDPEEGPPEWQRIIGEKEYLAAKLAWVQAENRQLQQEMLTR